MDDHDSDDDNTTEENTKFPVKINPGFLLNDVVLVVEEQQLYVNKDLLVSSSPVFAAWLKRDWQKEKCTENGKMELSFPGKRLDEMTIFLTCLLPIFPDKVTDDKLDTVLPLADEYQTETLLFECSTAIRERVESVYSKDIYIPPSRIAKYICWVEQFKLNTIKKCVVKLASFLNSKELQGVPDYDNVGYVLQLEIANARVKLLESLIVNSPNDAQRMICLLGMPLHNKYMSKWKENISKMMEHTLNQIVRFPPQSLGSIYLGQGVTSGTVSLEMANVFACMSISERFKFSKIYSKCIDKLKAENINKHVFATKWSTHYNSNAAELEKMEIHVSRMCKCT